MKLNSCIIFSILDLEQDIVDYSNFVKYITKEDREQLLKLLPPTESLTPPDMAN